MKRTREMSGSAERIVGSRSRLMGRRPLRREKAAQEGGCGVVGFAASVPVRGRHIFEPSIQMHNRGNGKGGGIAAAGFTAEQLGVDAACLRDDYILQIALLDPQAERDVEQQFVSPHLQIHHRTKLGRQADWRDLGLPVRPPEVIRYFVRVNNDRLSRFARRNNLTDAPRRTLEDELIYQNSFRLNRTFYASLGQKRAFVLSHARNLMVFKIVGYAEHVVQYYGLEDLQAQVWIAHQRYPTKGRVWHPAGSHPFIGMNEALVHNGDFANYFSICDYLRQHNIAPLFLTDTEVSVLLFDLLRRTYGYPIELVIEALAPTTELDFGRLPEAKQRSYKAIQALHMHGSPDGPWFFIIARTDPDANQFQLLGITDTSMLRPQVFALQESEAASGSRDFGSQGFGDSGVAKSRKSPNPQNPCAIGLVASEKQAIDATLGSLAAEDSRFRPVADRYWNARGGSHTDGGAFIFTVSREGARSTLCCTDKFGRQIGCPPGALPSEGTSSMPLPGAAKGGAKPKHPDHPIDGPPRRPTPRSEGHQRPVASGRAAELIDEINQAVSQGRRREFFGQVSSLIASWDFDRLRWFVEEIKQAGLRDGFEPLPRDVAAHSERHGSRPSDGNGGGDSKRPPYPGPAKQDRFEWALAVLSMLNDRRYDCGRMKRSAVVQIVREAIDSLLDATPPIARPMEGPPGCPSIGKAESPIRRIEWSTRQDLRPPKQGETTLVIFARDFPAEGKDCDASLAVRAYQLGWKRFIVYGLKGQRFTGCGLGAGTDEVRMDVFGSSGDYLASGIDGMQIHVHGSAQDQLGQIMKRGRLVVHGDVGQTFMYGAKGGEVYVMGNAAGRPLINAAGNPRVVINGTCLDYLAESFMAGDPLRGGGFVVLNGIEFDYSGRVRDQETPYPGSNLFSLASGGAIYVRDPHRTLVPEQLNGGEFSELTDDDWKLIRPYLEANQRHFGISVEHDLLTVDHVRRSPQEVYRKVRAVRLAVLAKEGIPE